MKSPFVIALLLASCSAIHLRSTESQDLTQTGGPNTAAPGGAKGETRYVMPVHAGLAKFNVNSLEHCPDFNERMTLLNGKTRAVSYPQAGFNCNANYGLAQGGPNTPAPGGAKGAKETRYVMPVHAGLAKFNVNQLEHCPDFNERMTLLNGKTRAVSYPQPGFNCNADYGLAQGGPNTAAPGGAKGETRYVMPVHAGLAKFNVNSLEHCPDFNERMTLLNGKTRAVSYPQPGFNCNANYGLVQGGPNTAAPGADAADTRYKMHVHVDNAKIQALEHCPNFNERMTLLNGKTAAVSYPNPGYNCNAHL